MGRASGSRRCGQSGSQLAVRSFLTSASQIRGRIERRSPRRPIAPLHTEEMETGARGATRLSATKRAPPIAIEQATALWPP
jgi:hypothetical protein